MNYLNASERHAQDIVGHIFAESFMRGEMQLVTARPLAPSDVVREILPESPTERVAERIEALEKENQALLELLDDKEHRIKDLEIELADWRENGIRATNPSAWPYDDDEEEPF